MGRIQGKKTASLVNSVCMHNPLLKLSCGGVVKTNHRGFNQYHVTLLFLVWVWVKSLRIYRESESLLCFGFWGFGFRGWKSVKMPDSEIELQERLKEAGNGLLNPPSSVDDLLDLLDVMSRHPLHLFKYTYIFLFALCACLFFNRRRHCIRMLNWLFVEYCFLGLISWCMDLNVLVFLVTTGMNWLFVRQICQKKCFCYSIWASFFNSFIKTH